MRSIMVLPLLTASLVSANGVTVKLHGITQHTVLRLMRQRYFKSSGWLGKSSIAQIIGRAY
jgi:hypothetical protein